MNPNCYLGNEVTLFADSSDPQDNELLFTWSVTAGRIRGEGRKVTWAVGGLPEGSYSATVEVNAGNGLMSFASTTVTIVHCPDCMTVVIPCPTVSVSCPAVAESKQPIVFEAMVSGGYTDKKVTYTWSLTAGKIMSGQGTTKITVDASNLVGQSTTATVNASGYDPRCSGNVAVCSVDEIR